MVNLWMFIEKWWKRDNYKYSLIETCSILPDFSCRGISFVCSSHVLPSSWTVPDPSIHYYFCPVGACSQQKPYMSHITLPTPLPAAKTSSCMRRKQELSHENLFDFRVLSAMHFSEPLSGSIYQAVLLDLQQGLLCRRRCVVMNSLWVNFICSRKPDRWGLREAFP